jgi:hypothetical protein
VSLTRVWTPSGSYSGGSKKRLIVLHTMEGFTGANGAYDCAKYFQGNVGASSQVCMDNNRGKIWECVSRGNGAWTQCNYNSVSVAAEQSGYASWSRDYWLANRENELRNTADWIAEEAKALGIPITELSSSQAQGGAAGVTYHSRLGSTGCGHSDPGGGYPLDKVLEWAKGGGSAPAPSGGTDVSASSAFYEGGLHLACVWSDGRVNYKPPNGTWYAVDSNPKATAKSGVGITVSDGGLIVLTYTNQSGVVCTYQKGVNDPASKWGWYDRGGSAR